MWPIATLPGGTPSDSKMSSCVSASSPLAVCVKIGTLVSRWALPMAPNTFRSPGVISSELAISPNAPQRSAVAASASAAAISSSVRSASSGGWNASR